MQALRRAENILSGVINGLLVFIFSVMLIIAVLQVALRYFFSTGLLWGDVAARNLVLWVGFLGAALAAKEEKHFHLDIVSRFLPKGSQAWLRRIASLFAAVICYLLGRASLDYIGMEGESTTFLDLPIAVAESIIPAGFLLMAVQFAIRAILGPSEVSSPSSNIQEPLPR